MPLGAVSLPVWSFADRTWSRGRLRCLRAIPLEVPLLSTIIASPSLLSWVPLGIFPRLFKNGFHSHCEGFHVFLCLSLPLFLFLIFPTLWLSEPVVTDYLKADLVHIPILIVYSGYLEPTEWEIYPLKSLFPLRFQDQFQWICKGLLSVYLGTYQELPSPPVLCLPIAIV